MKKIFSILLISLCLCTVSRADEINLAYGRLSFPAIAMTVGGALGTAITGGIAKIEDVSTSGAISIEYFHDLNRVISVGGIVNPEFINLTYEGSSKSSDIFLSLMPAAKFSWFKKDHVSMYSKVSAGASFIFAKNAKTNYAFAFNVAPVGIDFGGQHFRGFTEAGFGCQGILMAGIKYIF